MIKVAVLDDYQNVFNQIIDLEKYKNKYIFKVFNESTHTFKHKMTTTSQNWTIRIMITQLSV